MGDVYRVDYEPDEAELLEDMRKKIAVSFSVSLTGNRLFLRWQSKGEIVSAHMVILKVTTPGEKIDERLNSANFTA